MLDGIQVTESADELGHIILRIFEGEFAGCEYFYDKVTFAEKPNDDGTADLNFEYTITNGYSVPKDKSVEFNQYLGRNLVALIEEAIEANSAVYHGGVGGVLT